MTSEAAGTRPIIFSIKSYHCMPKAGSHSIQGMAGHSGQTRTQTNKQIPLCFISIDIYKTYSSFDPMWVLSMHNILTYVGGLTKDLKVSELVLYFSSKCCYPDEATI